MADAETHNAAEKQSQSNKSFKKRSQQHLFPTLDLCPREKQSYLNSIARINRGRIIRETKKEQVNRSLPVPSKRVKFKAVLPKNTVNIPTSPNYSTCCNSKHNGRFPSTAQHRLYLLKNLKIRATIRGHK
uniref:Uncharacterized protein n=1 Tax=Trichobilharzia regenti TaxID=157069 RepID=A0AA85KB08_TRIRE|nr:unnamed protein product [Trichobilharzia regenti]